MKKALLAIIISLFFFSGCVLDTEGGKIYKKAVAYAAGHPSSTYKANMTITSGISGVGNMTTTAQGVFDSEKSLASVKTNFAGYDQSSKETTNQEIFYLIVNGSKYQQINGVWSKFVASSTNDFDSKTTLEDVQKQNPALDVVGEETINGIPAYVIKGELAPSEGLKLTQGLYKNAISGLSEETYTFKSGTITLWIGKETPAILKIREEANAQLNELSVHTVVTRIYYDWGVPVKIEIPPDIK